MTNEFMHDQAGNTLDDHTPKCIVNKKVNFKNDDKNVDRIWEHIRQQRSNGDDRTAEEIFTSWLQEGRLHTDRNRPDDQPKP